MLTGAARSNLASISSVLCLGLWCAAILVIAFGLSTSPVSAQAAAPQASQPVSPATRDQALRDQELRDYIARMDADQLRGLLVDRLAARPAVPNSPSGDEAAADTLTQSAGLVFRDVRNSVLDLPRLPAAVAKEGEGFLRGYSRDHRGTGHVYVFSRAGWWGGLILLLECLGVLIAGGLITYGLRAAIRQRLSGAGMNALKSLDPNSIAALVARTAGPLLGVATFGFLALTVAFVVFGLPDWMPVAQWPNPGGISLEVPSWRAPIRVVGNGELYVFTHILFGMLACWVAWRLGQAVFAPRAPQERLVNCDDRAAAFFGRQTVVITLLCMPWAVLIPILTALGYGSDVASGATTAGTGARLGFWFTSVLIATCIYTMLRPYRAWTMIMLGFGNPGPVVRMFATIWPLVASLLFLALFVYLRYVVAQFGASNVNDLAGFLTIFVIFFLPVFDTAMRALIERFTLIRSDRLSPQQAKANEIVRTGLTPLGRNFVLVGLILILVSAWNIPLLKTAAGEGWLGPQLVSLVLILLVAYAAWSLIDIFARRQSALDSAYPANTEMGGDGGDQEALGRLGTVMPVLRRAGQVVIAITALFLCLSALSVNTTPLLAATGVIGLAVGFGAQTLVKDVVSGVFYLAEDTFRVGEFVDIAGTEGTVEKISFRLVSLRGTRGQIHSIPYGEITKLTNFSRDWAMMKLRFVVPYATDIGKVRRIFKKIGQDMDADPEFGPDFLMPFKSQGVVDVNDVGLIVRGKFMTKPGKQWLIRKEIYQRVQHAFEEAGIDFARREVHVHVPRLDEADAGGRERAARIAAQAVSQDDAILAPPAKPA